MKEKVRQSVVFLLVIAGCGGLLFDFGGTIIGPAIPYIGPVKDNPGSLDLFTTAELSHLSCILIASPDQEDVERDYYRDVLGFRSEFLFARSREEGRMMVAGNRGFMPVEMRAQVGRTGSAIRRIPLVGQGGQLKSEYYCYWPKDRTNNLIEEFADILAGMLESTDAG